MPQFPLGSDDEFVVEVAWEGPEAERTWEPASGVFDGTTAVQQTELTALRLKVDQKRVLAQLYDCDFFFEGES